MQWKEDFERSTYLNHVLKSVLTVSNETKVTYYYCNRVSVYKPDGQGKHQLKTPGSAKIKCHCTAHLPVSNNNLLFTLHFTYEVWGGCLLFFITRILNTIYNNHERFSTYLNTNYCTRLQRWATCYRVGSAVNTNMFLEAFHRILKIGYLHHKQNKWVDSLFVALIKISRYPAFQRLRKLKMDKYSNKICEIMKQDHSGKK